MNVNEKYGIKVNPRPNKKADAHGNLQVPMVNKLYMTQAEYDEFQRRAFGGMIPCPHQTANDMFGYEVFKMLRGREFQCLVVPVVDRRVSLEDGLDANEGTLWEGSVVNDEPQPKGRLLEGSIVNDMDSNQSSAGKLALPGSSGSGSREA